MKKTSFLLCLILFYGCNSPTKQDNGYSPLTISSTQESSSEKTNAEDINIPCSYNFSLSERKVSEIKDNLKKVEYILIINEKYQKKELDEIANYIKATDKDQIRYIFISFYLNDMSLNGPNYAISKRTPDLNSTQINYIEPVKEEPKNKPPYSNSQLFGKWQMAGEATTAIFKKGESFYMIDQYTPNEYGDPEKLIHFTNGGRDAFRFAEDTGEVFVIMQDGLYGYMNGDLSCVFNKIK